MSNSNSPTFDKVIENVVEGILQEKAEEVQREMVGEENQENAIEVVPKEIEVVVDEGEAKAFYSYKGAKAFQKHLTKKSFIEERGFKELV